MSSAKNMKTILRKGFKLMPALILFAMLASCHNSASTSSYIRQPSGGDDAACTSDSECSSGLSCVDGICVSSDDGTADETYVKEIRAAADYIASTQRDDGAISNSHDTDWFNTDNNMGYALMGLYFAYVSTGDDEYLDAMKRALSWQASVQDSDGCWHWGYRQDPDGMYFPAVSDYYTGEGISDIKSVDAIQAFFAYNLWLYSLAGDADFVEAYKKTAEDGIECLIANNLDGDETFFYSSQQMIGADWKRLNIKYAMGQADVFLGLMAAWKLTGNISYYDYAMGILENFDDTFFDEANGRYAIGVDEDNQTISDLYMLAQATPTFFLHNISNDAKIALAHLEDKLMPIGTLDPADLNDTIDVAGMALAATTVGKDRTARLAKEYVAEMQVVSDSTADGAIRYDAELSGDDTSYLYINVAGFGIMALSGEARPDFPLN